MKKLLTVMAGAALFTACQQGKYLTMDLNVNDKKLDSVGVFMQNFDTVVALSSDGKASLRIPYDGQKQYGLVKYKWNKSPIYVDNAKKMSVTWDMTPAELAASFGGQNANKNAFINGKELEGPIMKDFGRQEDDLLETLQDYLNKDYKILEGKKFDALFTAKEKQRIEFWIYGMLSQYVISKGGTDKSYNKLESLLKDDDNLMQMTSYVNFLTPTVTALSTRGQVINAMTKKDLALTIMNYTVKRFKSPRIREMLLGTTALSYVNNYGLDGADEMKSLLESSISDKDVIDAFNSAYNEAKKLSKGVKCPDFTMTDINGKTYTLKDFAGKVLYIDIWATWCMPCQQEIPIMQKMIPNFEGTNVCFISMSIDQKKEAWEKQVKEQKLQGYQLYAGPKSSFIEAFKVNGIPRFILIDKDGNIVNANMSRPSEPSTIQVLGNMAEAL